MNITGAIANALTLDDDHSHWHVVRRDLDYVKETCYVYKVIVVDIRDNKHYYFLFENPKSSEYYNEFKFASGEEVYLHEVRPREVLTTVYEEI